MSEKNTSTKLDEHFPRWNRMVRQERERRDREGTNNNKKVERKERTK